ncbi:MAG: nucleoside hydrolase, partial [Verrucomicrobiae bacterium]|nr:nucleoside hydrolase [Verrucomicrobiae bacterium]
MFYPQSDAALSPAFGIAIRLNVDQNVKRLRTFNCVWYLIGQMKALLMIRFVLGTVVVTLSGMGQVPVLYSTDLLHPHDDPDDHYDLATLFAIKEFDIRAIVLDLGERQTQRCGKPALEQMFKITGRRVPWAIGLGKPLRNRTDDARDQASEFQGGVELILSELRRARDPVLLFTTGSCRDVAAAFNRDPELVRRKVRALYMNIGRGPNEKQDEWNVHLDRAAYLRLFESGLPLFWCPCFGTNGYQTLFVVDQTRITMSCTRAVQNYFIYCLAKSTADPIAFLESTGHQLPSGPRNMWCTAPMLHAAGRRIYQRPQGDYI